jgi:CCR4-NOT transcription complex subunit 7/8
MRTHDGEPSAAASPPLYSFVHVVLQQQYPRQPAPMAFTPGGSMMEAAAKKEVRAEVRDVWAGNLDAELANLSAVLPHYPCVCVDTEFPGAVHGSDTPRHLRGPRESYALVKRNVDDLKLLQVGIALSGPAGRFPVAWQFNLRGFDPARHPYAPASIAMLRAQGMDFAALNKFGVDPYDFAVGFHRSGLACGQLTWTAFSGAYDFAYLAKVLTGGQPLPATLDGFLALVRRLFGCNVLDVKHLARCCAMRGGLEQVSAALGVERAAGRAHCAGSDSLLTTDVLLAMMNRFFTNVDVLAHAGTIVDLA